MRVHSLATIHILEHPTLHSKSPKYLSISNGSLLPLCRSSLLQMVPPLLSLHGCIWHSWGCPQSTDPLYSLELHHPHTWINRKEGKKYTWKGATLDEYCFLLLWCNSIVGQYTHMYMYTVWQETFKVMNWRVLWRKLSWISWCHQLCGPQPQIFIEKTCWWHSNYEIHEHFLSQKVPAIQWLYSSMPLYNHIYHQTFSYHCNA